MRKQSFSDWLVREADSSRMALVGLYENRDRILYVEAPRLRKKYMEIIGIYEEPVLQAELDVAMLRRKAELIRIAINRREPINPDGITEQLNKERQEQISELEKTDRTLNELPEPDEQQAHTMQQQYREITRYFHPAMNSSLTETQKELFQKAVDAYKMQDGEAIRLIHDMLFPAIDLKGISVSVKSGEIAANDPSHNSKTIFDALSPDYTLAAKLYDSFAPSEEERIILEMLSHYKAQRKELEEEIAQIRSGFPFNALETINSRTKTEEYLAELRLRAARCEREKAELESQIASMTEDRKNG